MWKLTIEDDEQKQTSLQLAHDEYGIGRDEANALRLTDRNISRKHARLVRNGEGWIVRDLESYNGTYVNGLRVVGEQAVVHGDILQLGDYRLEFIDEKRLVPQATEQAPQPLPAHHRPDRLVVVVGPQPGQEFFLDREHFVIGRSEDAAISINHSSVSRHHADLFAVGNGRFEVIDKGSANGIRINGQEVRRGFIEAGDALELGDVRLRFVGAGKIFRAGFDRSQALPAIQGYEAAIKASKPSGGPNVLRMVGFGALLGVIGVGAAAAYVSTRGGAGASPTVSVSVSAVPEDPGKKSLAEAKALAAEGNLEGAHKKIAEIPADSPSLQDPAVADIEGRWADDAAKRAEAETDPQKQVELLWAIATTPTVDETRRRNASEKLKDVGVEAPDPLTVKPGMPSMPLPTNFVPKPPAPKASSTPVGPRAPGSVDRQTLSDPKGRMNELLGRFGSLTELELKMLIGLCQQEGNPQCLQKAAARLGELKKQKEAGGENKP